MNINEIFKKIRNDIEVIKSNSIIREQYNSLEEFLKSKNINIIHSFSQIKRNEHYKGLVNETMFFDEKYIYDIVVGVDNIDIHIVLLKHVSKVNVSTIPNYINEKNEDETNSQRVEFHSQLIIAYQEQSQLYYVTPTEKYTELLVIADILTKMIAK